MYLESVLCRLFQVVPCSEQVALYRFFLPLACSKSFQVVSCSLQVVSGRFLLVVAPFKLFLARYRLFQIDSCSLQVVSERFRSFRVLVSTVFSQYFLVTSRKVMKTSEAPDVWRLYKNMNCAFPLMILLNSLYFSTKQFFPQKSLVYQTV